MLQQFQLLARRDGHDFEADGLKPPVYTAKIGRLLKKARL
jgi:hypothetical protein